MALQQVGTKPKNPTSVFLEMCLKIFRFHFVLYFIYYLNKMSI